MKRFAAVLLLVTVGLFTMPLQTATASYRPGCASATARWAVNSTNVITIQQATLHVTQTRCWNRSGYLTLTTVDEWTVDTSAGEAFGVTIPHSKPYPHVSDEGMQQWITDYAMHACFAHWTLFCGQTVDWRIVVDILAPRLHGWVWHNPFCTTRACAAHVAFRRTG